MEQKGCKLNLLFSSYKKRLVQKIKQVSANGSDIEQPAAEKGRRVEGETPGGWKTAIILLGNKQMIS